MILTWKGENYCGEKESIDVFVTYYYDFSPQRKNADLKWEFYKEKYFRIIIREWIGW